jgi:hypothetical protein
LTIRRLGQISRLATSKTLKRDLTPPIDRHTDLQTMEAEDREFGRVGLTENAVLSGVSWLIAQRI